MTTVRVVEDDPSLASLWRWMLEDKGYDVLTTTRAFDRLLRPEPWLGVDIALVDLMLPDVSGEEILRYLRDAEPGIRCIGMTAGSKERVRNASEELGVPVLPKPFGVADLMEVIGDG